MTREYAPLRVDIWSSDGFKALSAGAQRLYIVAVSSADLNMCGVVPFTVKRWAGYAVDTTPMKVRRAVRELQAARYVLVDEDTDELMVRSFTRHDGTVAKPNLCINVARTFPAVASPMLRAAFLVELHRLHDEDAEGNGSPKGWRILSGLLGQRLPKGFPEGFPEGFYEGFPKGLAELYPDGSLEPLTEPLSRAHDARVRTRGSSSSTPTPTPSPTRAERSGNPPAAAPVDNPPDDDLRIDTGLLAKRLEPHIGKITPEYARSIAGKVLSLANGPIGNPTGYVVTAVAREPATYRPTTSPPSPRELCDHGRNGATCPYCRREGGET